MMAWHVFAFEMRQRLRAPGTWITLGVVLFFTLRNFTSAFFDAMLGGGAVARDSPYIAYTSAVYSSFWAMLFGTWVAGGAPLKDVQARTARIVFATPVTDRAYFVGKWAAGVATLLFVMLGDPIGFLLIPAIGRMTGHPAAEFIPFNGAAMLQAWLLFNLPACLLFGTVYASLAARAGRIAVCFVASALFLFVFLYISMSDASAGSAHTLQVLDPMGLASFHAQSNYWSVAQKNTSLLALPGTTLLLNRALYLGVTMLVFGLAVWRFDARVLLDRAAPRRRRTEGEESFVPVAGGEAVRPRRASGFGPSVRIALGVGWREWRVLARDRIFRILVGFLLFFVVVDTAASGVQASQSPDGTVLPTFGAALKTANELFFLIGAFALLFFAGEVMGRERRARVDKMVDASPLPDAVFLGGKAVALGLLALTFGLIPPLGAVIAQLLRGGVAFEWGPVAQSLFFGTGLAFVCFAALTLFLHAVARSRTVGGALSFFVLATLIMGSEIGTVETHRSLFGIPHELRPSGFAIQGQFWELLRPYGLAWVAMAGLLVVLALWLWPRGTAGFDLFSRLRSLPQRVTLASGTLATAFLGAFVLAQGAIGHGLALGGFRPRIEERAEAAAYERTYGSLRGVPQPKIVRADADLDLRGTERRAELTVDLTVANRSAASIPALHLNLPEDVVLVSLSWNGRALTASQENAELRHAVYPLPASIAPGATARLTLRTQAAYPGYLDDGWRGTLASGASVVFLRDLLPSFGYDRSREVADVAVRRQLGLPSRVALPSADAPTADLAATPDAERLDWNLRVATDPDQTVVTPGTAGHGLFDLAVTAAPYTMQKADCGGTTVEVYASPRHPSNVARFLDAARFALDRLRARYGPYPYPVVRFAEVPDGFVDAETAAGCLFLVPESRGFLSGYRSGGAGMDLVQYVVAKELARAYFGDRLAPVRSQGHGFVSEALPAYAALDVLAARDGRKMADAYASVLRDRALRGAAKETGVRPTLLTGDDQPYLADQGAAELWSQFKDAPFVLRDLPPGAVRPALAAKALTFSVHPPRR